MMLSSNWLRGLVTATGIAGAALMASSAAQAATFVIVNADSPGQGFNDTTPASPVGGNNGTTLGQQRMNAFQAAANIWGNLLTSNITIRVNSKFSALSCNANSGTLGSAGPNTVNRNFSGAPRANTYYVAALANSLANTDLDPSDDDISASFNSNIGNPGCLPSLSWYLGLDSNPPSGALDFVSVLIHELGHGLGFLSLVDLQTGAKFNGFDDAYMVNLERHGASPSDFPSMSNAQRLAAHTDTGNLHWIGANVRSAAGALSAGVVGDHVRMYAPSPAESGSSVSHWDTVLTPNQVMEPSYTQALHAPIMELPAFKDISWPVTATFYTVSLSANPTAGGTLSGGGTFPSGAAVTATATANSGYQFTSWTEGASVVSTSASYSFTVSAGRNLVANFSGGTAPAAPIATSATNITASSFTANWNAADNATGYNIDVARDAGFTTMVYFNMGVGNVTSASIAGLLGGTVYYYRVRASNGLGASGNSNTISATTTLPAPTATAATDVRGTSFTANWTSVSGATGYNVDVSASPSFSPLIVNNLNAGAATSASITGLSPSTPYYFRVRAATTITSANSNAVGATTTAPWLLVSPSTGMIGLGSKGGPFNPSSFSYQIRSESGALNWSVAGVPDWLTASASSGATDVNGTTVTFSLNTAATTKAVGSYGPSTVTFTNVSNGQGGTTRTAGLTVSPVACEAVTKGPDFGGDGKGDLLWRNDNGAVAAWLMDGAAPTSGFGLGTVTTDWRLVATADFNKDGRSDLLWRNTSSGQLVIWFVSGVAATGSVSLGAAPLDWNVVGAADFNGDGHADILWRNDTGTVAMWLLTNGVPQSGPSVATIALDWRIVGLGDFNADGKADILWRNSSGAATIWLMNGAAVPAQASLGVVPTDWRIYGVNDFNGDGKADILWRSDGGTVAMWLMNGLTPLSGPTVGFVSTDWRLAGTSDFNNDGKGDLLWRSDSGIVAFWLMNGATLVSSGGAGGIGYDWHLVNGEHDRPVVLINPGPC